MSTASLLSMASSIVGLLLLFLYVVPKLVKMRGKLGHLFATGSRYASLSSGDILSIIIFLAVWWILSGIIASILMAVLIPVLGLIPVIGIYIGLILSHMSGTIIAGAAALLVVGLLKS